MMEIEYFLKGEDEPMLEGIYDLNNVMRGKENG